MHQDEVKIITPEHVVLRFQTAGLGSRFAAQLIDSIIMYGSMLLIYIALIAADAIYPDFFFYLEGIVEAVMILIVFLITFGYCICFEYFGNGQTPGKRALGLKVVQEQGQPLTFLSAVIRNLLRLVDFLPGLYLLGCMFIFFHPQHKRVGDLAAGTIVIYQRSGTAAKELQQKDLLLNRLSSVLVPMDLDPLLRRNFTLEDWQLLAVYMRKRNDLPASEKMSITVTVARNLLPKAGLDPEWKSIEEYEQDLTALYLALRSDWEHI